MKRFDAISRLHRLLTAPHQPPVSLRRICDELECSESTAKRCIRDLRERFAHPIEFDPERGGYYYERGEAGDGFELPGLWFTESELTALLTMRQLLAEVHPGLFEREIAPLGRRIEKILEKSGLDAGEVAKRIRILSLGRRRVSDPVFRSCADAVLMRKRLTFLYKARSRPADGERTRSVSPQRLVHYRDNWYLDAWCHERDALRIFALDQMRNPCIASERARDIPEQELDAVLKTGYGIFAGEPERRALLRFRPERAQWVSKEKWHPAQVGEFLSDGSWQLSVPYSKPDELVMDILKHGPHVEVVEPTELRAQVGSLLAEAGVKYAAGAKGGMKESA